MPHENDPPQHCLTVDPDKEWAKGWIGFFHRWRGLAVAGGGKTLGLIGVQYLWQNWWITGSGLTVLGTAWVLLLLHRNHLIWCWNDKRTLHDFCHWLRDSSLTRPSSQADIATWMERFSEKACQHIAYHFRAVLRDQSVTCAIRLAKKVGGQESFYTMGRSDGMDPNRARNSKPIDRDKGIARTLMDKDKQGIWIIPDIPKAISLGMWEKSDNDILEDLKFVMVAPINAYESGSKAMLGILYVCSRDRRFQPLDTVELRAWADLLGLAYSEAGARLSSQ